MSQPPRHSTSGPRSDRPQRPHANDRATSAGKPGAKPGAKPAYAPKASHTAHAPKSAPAGRPPRPGQPREERPQQGAPGGRPRQQGAPSPVPENLPRYPGVITIVLRSGTATPVLSGHPWIFSGAIGHILPPTGTQAENGQQCAVFDPHARFLGHGTYHSQSQIAIRLLEAGTDGLEPARIPDIATIVTRRLERATKLRADLGLPSAQTDAFRLVNSEGDGLPGVVIDRYAAGAVVQMTTAGAFRWREPIVAWLRAHGCAWVLERVPMDVHPSEGLLAGFQSESGDVPTEVQVRHNGLLLRVEPGGQKTGMYTDQRVNHARVAELAKGRFVLDCYSHVGGFGLHAARAGAAKVQSVDASQRAVDLAIQHASDNGVAVDAQCADAVHVLGHFASLPPEGERPSLVIVDPPKFATKASALEQAIRKYTHVNTLAMQAVAEDGFLVTCSCSGLVDPQSFLRVLGQAAHNAGRSVQLLELRGPGPDHPVAPAHAEGQYLKVAICRISRRAV